jgi:nitric oxide reductase activation protein
VERNADYEGSGYSSAATDIERMLESMAQERVAEALEDELCDELQALADEIRYGNAHKGIKVRINRMSAVSEYLVHEYDKVYAPLIQLSKRMQKQVAPILKDKREGGKQTGLLFGKRFSTRDTFRNDGRLFYNNRLPSDPMELAVAVLCDESGSMSGYDRATVARSTSIVLYDFCRSLNIPVAIYGHTTSSHNSDVELFAHAEFESIDSKDKYRLMDISARGSNRDGAALRFTAERLLKRPELLKLLILISDGQPHDGYGYYGTAAEADLRGIKQEYTRKGIKLFVAAIGDDKPNIERIYGDGFLDITDLNKLPYNMCSLLSQHIKAM